MPSAIGRSANEIRSYELVHVEFVEDKQGNAIDVKVYCNSTCAYLNDKAEAYPAGYESDTCVFCANDGCNKVVITGTDCEYCMPYGIDCEFASN
jgi:hypothetical protein